MNTTLEEWQKRYECAKCQGIVYSKFSNHTSRCQCGAIAVEQAPWMNCKMGKEEDFLDPERKDTQTTFSMYGEDDDCHHHSWLNGMDFT
jgi:hypothetical protein